MGLSIWQIAIVVVLVVLLFGRGKISSLMGDVAKGIKSFKKGMASDTIEDDTQKNISENQSPSNQDSTNQDSTNQDSSTKE
ncbi:MAG: twin-arginine translocase TatA/TatE family subunit [Candidatus Pelagibacter bacterium]|jgi:sec-independent protein translocase protein TatA|nr:twin-arginine translocase TatA/TatE family subunit [Candidatus Pelagibacter sp.]MDP7540976.1 twin-arginine translocase TatA/TatE family subunit [Candidatus Pelagibacter bacterium]|tara:strand:- start:275 stop:517 length:243 start_codon:yes stop_codon:yes gene_type:complete